MLTVGTQTETISNTVETIREPSRVESTLEYQSQRSAQLPIDAQIIEDRAMVNTIAPVQRVTKVNKISSNRLTAMDSI